MHVAVAVVYMSVLCVPIPRKKEKGGIHTRKRVLTATASRETAFNKLSAVFCEPFFGTVSPSLSLVSVCLCNRREKKPSFLRRKNAPLSTPSDQHLFLSFLSRPITDRQTPPLYVTIFVCCLGCYSNSGRRFLFFFFFFLRLKEDTK